MSFEVILVDIQPDPRAPSALPLGLPSWLPSGPPSGLPTDPTPANLHDHARSQVKGGAIEFTRMFSLSLL